MAKASLADDALRDLTNELARVRRRLRKAELKLKGLHALKEDLRSRLPAEEYEYMQVKLQREVEQWEKAETELQRRCSDARTRHNYGDETFKPAFTG